MTIWVEQDVHRVALAGSGGTLTCGVDGGDLRVTLAVPARDAVTVKRPKSRRGLGGMGLVVSPNERFAAWRVYTGQSEEGCELLALEPTLRRVAGFLDTDGEGAGPVFSPSSEWLASLCAVTARVRGTGAYFEQMQNDDSDERVVVDWAVLRVFRTDNGTVHEVPVGVEVPLSTDIDDVNEWTTYGEHRQLASGTFTVESVMDFTASGELTALMPWGEKLVCPLPPPASLTARGPAKHVKAMGADGGA